MWHVFLMLCVFNFWITPCLLQSNVHREVRKKPDPPCEVCTGSGRVNCHDCCGRGLSLSFHLMCTLFSKFLLFACFPIVLRHTTNIVQSARNIEVILEVQSKAIKEMFLDLSFSHRNLTVFERMVEIQKFYHQHMPLKFSILKSRNRC